jgi:hypothetical protein
MKKRKDREMGNRKLENVKSLENLKDLRDDTDGLTRTNIICLLSMGYELLYETNGSSRFPYAT